MMKRIITIAILFIAMNVSGQTSYHVTDPTVPEQSWAQQLAATAMTIWKDSFSLTPGRPARWSYDQGVILKGIEGIWRTTGDGNYFRYIQKCMDFYVREDGTIKDYRPDEFNIDHVNNGKLLLLLYRVTEKPKYKKAADLLRYQLRNHPRTNEGGFWHKKIYPYQMWLDGLYMGEPFYAEYAMVTGEDSAFNDITRQFTMMERHARDARTGLLYHGYDESREQKWANKETGLSPHFWARAMGWYGMAMVDALDYFPAKHPGRDSIIAILNRFAAASIKVQDAKTGLWYDIMDKPGAPKNYFEASASCMLVYALAKGVRKGYINATYLHYAKKGYAGILKEFIEKDANGQVNLKGTVSVSGLGGNPYRDGSYEYYMSEKVVVNDPKGMGAFILAADEMELVPKLTVAKGKNVLLDCYFNNEAFKEFGGRMIRNHYVWDENTNNGFSFLGGIFNYYGARTSQLEAAPTATNLKGTDLYIIVDPDGLKDNKNPNYVEDAHVKAITDWVKQGGVLFLMANDSANCDIKHFNKLANAFGLHFTDKGRNFVQGNQYETGAIAIPAGNAVFKQTKKVYLKEISMLEVKSPAKALVTESGDIIMAVSKYGKGTVFAVGDPWLYNEYTDGRKIPAEYENFKAAEELSKWLLQQTGAKK